MNTPPAIAFILPAFATMTALAAATVFPDACERAWLRVANAVTFGWHRRLQPRVEQPRCFHIGAVPVEDLAGETVAHLCASCGEQLPAEWKPSLTDVFFDPRLLGRR